MPSPSESERAFWRLPLRQFAWKKARGGGGASRAEDLTGDGACVPMRLAPRKVDFQGVELHVHSWMFLCASQAEEVGSGDTACLRCLRVGSKITDVQVAEATRAHCSLHLAFIDCYCVEDRIK